MKITSTFLSVMTFGAFFNAYIRSKSKDLVLPKEDRTILDDIHTNVVSFISYLVLELGNCKIKYRSRAINSRSLLQAALE